MLCLEVEKRIRAFDWIIYYTRRTLSRVFNDSSSSFPVETTAAVTIFGLRRDFSDVCISGGSLALSELVHTEIFYTRILLSVFQHFGVHETAEVLEGWRQCTNKRLLSRDYLHGLTTEKTQIVWLQIIILKACLNCPPYFHCLDASVNQIEKKTRRGN